MNIDRPMEGIRLALRMATLLRENPDGGNSQAMMQAVLDASVSELWSALVFNASILNTSLSPEAWEALGLAALKVEGEE